MTDTLLKTIFGRLSWDALPLHEPILLATFIAVAYVKSWKLFDFLLGSHV